ncbi:MAG: hypothetical protein ACTHU5_00940 [Psychrobacter sp.]|uniref:hypothetical protein n=1 Tax=Psychrobacter sp. B29-1 TaxID=1867800 RepID=UPI00086E84E1|nr:hypothetical protein [Psychrobacter sp. B29-1]OEH69181.1 MAG: hypothetical protein BAX61_03065 [Psychrobacter sp. B29-1]
MDWKYWPECWHALMAMIYNVVLVLAVAWVVVSLYKLSGSLLALLGFVALLMVARVGFKRD